jgi:phospholipid N-methyltransferase
LNKKKHFLRQFIQHRKKIGSVIPSSPRLVKKMLDNVDFKHKANRADENIISRLMGVMKL